MTTTQRIRLQEQDQERAEDTFARLWPHDGRTSRIRTVARSARGKTEVHAYFPGLPQWEVSDLNTGRILYHGHDHDAAYATVHATRGSPVRCRQIGASTARAWGG